MFLLYAIDELHDTVDDIGEALGQAREPIAGEQFALIGDLSALVERVVPWPWS